MGRRCGRWLRVARLGSRRRLCVHLRPNWIAVGANQRAPEVGPSCLSFVESQLDWTRRADCSACAPLECARPTGATRTLPAPGRGRGPGAPAARMRARAWPPSTWRRPATCQRPQPASHLSRARASLLKNRHCHLDARRCPARNYFRRHEPRIGIVWPSSTRTGTGPQRARPVHFVCVSHDAASWLRDTCASHGAVARAGHLWAAAVSHAQDAAPSREPYAAAGSSGEMEPESLFWCAHASWPPCFAREPPAQLKQGQHSNQ